jgi:predicted nuclease of predicted toxin-antitoxin system
LKIKLDENMPAAAKVAAETLGHDVETVADEGMQGAPDRDVFEAAQRESRFLITLDVDFGDVRQYPPGSHAGIAILRLDSTDFQTTTDAVRRLLTSHELGDLTRCLVVVRKHLIRVRRPE